MMSKKIFLSVAILFAGVMFFGAKDAYAAGTVSGTVTESNGSTAVPYASVSIYDTNWMYSNWASTDALGAYSFADVPAGSYTVSVWASHTTEKNPAEQTVTVTESGSHTVNFQLIGANVTFTVVESDGVTPVSDLSYTAYNSNWSYYEWGTTGVDGSGSLGVPSNGTYYLDFYGSGLGGSSAPATQTFSYTGTAVPLGNLLMRSPAAQIKVVLPDGTTPCVSCWVQVYDSGYSYNGYWSGSTDSNGEVSVGALNPGTYNIDVQPPYSNDGTGYIAPSTVILTVEAGVTNTDYYTTPLALVVPTKTITATVRFSDGSVPSNVGYYGWGMDNQNYFYGSATNGNFTIETGRGKYEITVYNEGDSGGFGNFSRTFSTDDTKWGYTGDPKRVKFEGASNVEELSAIAFSVVPFDATVTGTVLGANGSVMSSGWASVELWSDNVYSHATVSQTDGSFSVPVPAGTYQFNMWGTGEDEGPPQVSPITIKSGQTVALGTLNTRAKTAIITGRISDRNGNALSNQNVNISTIGGGTGSDMFGGEWGWGMTDSSGDYSIKVLGGSYMVSAFPGWNYGENDNEYINTQGPARITVAANGTITQNFTFAVADSKIKGTVVDSDGVVIKEMYGWVDASISGTDSLGYYWSSLGGGISAGTFEFAVAGGLDYDLNVWTPPDGDYTPSVAESVTVGSNATVDGVIITMLENDVTLTGELQDTDGNPVEDSGAMVFAENGAGAYYWTDVESDGSYSMKIAAGTWKVSYSMGHRGYNAAYIPSYNTATKITPISGEELIQNLTLRSANAEIQATVTDQNGDAAANVWVSVATELGGNKISDDNPFAKYDRGEFTDESGQATIKVPGGLDYYVTAYVPQTFSGVIAPSTQIVSPTDSTPATVAIQFIEPDVTVTGTVDLDSTATDDALVWAWSENGQTAEATTDENGAYSLALTSGTDWHIGADYDDGSSGYEVSDTEITPAADSAVDMDLSLGTTATDAIPEDITQTFAAENQGVLEVDDASGSNLMKLSAPARSISSDNDADISVTVTTTKEAPEQAGDDPVGLAYDVQARTAGNSGGQSITDLAATVTLTLAYDETALPDGVTEDELTIGYYDTAANKWRTLTNISLDEEANTISGNTDHFTLFGVLAPNGSANDQVNDTPDTPTPDIDDGTDDDTTSPDEDDDGEADVDVTTYAKEYILLMPESLGSPLVRVVDSEGVQFSKFYAYNQTLRGGFQAMNADIDGDGAYEIVTVAGSGFGPQLRAFEADGTFIADIFTHDTGYRGGLNMVVLDMNGDGYDDIAVAPSEGVSNVRVYHYNTTADEFQLHAWKTVYDAGYTNGVNLAKADVNGDGLWELLTAPSLGTGNVRVYQLGDNELTLHSWFMAYDSAFRGGVNLAGADVNGGGNDEIVTVPALGRANLRVYRYVDSEWTTWDWVFAFDTGFTGGANVVAGNIDIDTADEIIVAPASNGGANVRAYDWADGELVIKDWGMAYGTAYRGGVELALVDVNQNGDVELVTAPTVGHTPNIRVYNWNGSRDLVSWFWGFAQTFRGGVNLGS